MNAAVAESEQRWQNREQELQTQISELQRELSEEQVRLLHKLPVIVCSQSATLIFTIGV